MSETLLKTYLRDHADGESLNLILTRIEGLSLSDTDCSSLQNCLVELCGNNVLYTPPDEVDHVYVEVLYDKDEADRIKIVACGVIDQPKWENLSKKVEFVQGKNHEELLAFRNEFLLAQVLSRPLSPEQEKLMSTSYGSQEGSAGIVTIAALAKAPLSLRRGTNIEGLFHFTLLFDLMLEEPLRHNPCLSREVGEPLICG
jgi:hypothetical protein